MSGLDISQRSVGQGGTRIIDPRQQQMVRDATVRLVQKILAGSNLDVSFSKGITANGRAQKHVKPEDDIPELEEVKATAREIAGNLEKVILLLQLEADDKLKKIQERRIDSAKGAFDARHSEMNAKIRKNIKAMEKAARQQLIQKIMGWAMVGVSVIMTIATCGAAVAASGALATAGAAAATATTAAAGTATTAATTATTATVAGAATAAGTTSTAAAVLSALACKSVICSAISTLVSATMQTLNETGAMEKATNWLADQLRSSCRSREKAQMWAQIILGVGTMVLTLPTSLIGGKGLADMLDFGMKAKVALFAAQSAMSVGSLVQQGFTVDAQNASALADAAVTEARSMIQLVEQMLEEIQQELEEVLTQMQNLTSDMFAIINSKMETEAEIARHMGAMGA